MKLPAIIGRLLPQKWKAAVTPLSFGDGWPIRESFAGAWQSSVVVDAPRDVLAFAATYACVTKIAGDIAKMRLMLVKEQADGTCAEVNVSPFIPVLDKPNHYQTRIKFLQQWMISKLIHGNTYVLKGRDARGIVTKLYVLDPQRVKVLVGDTGDVFYALGADNLAGTREVRVPAAEIIHDLMPPLWHPLVGVSPLYAGGLAATLGNKIQRNSTAFFQNMSRAGGFLMSPGKLGQEEAEELKRQWEANYTGTNAGRTAVLANGLTYQDAKPMPAQEAQLNEQWKSSVEDVARSFGVPLFKIGGPIPANTSIEALQQQYYDECLQVHIEDLEAALREGLSLPRDMDVKFNLDDLLRMDTAAMAEAEARLVGAGIKTPNESRRKLNLPPVSGGDACYLQQQNYSTEALGKRDAKDDPFDGADATATKPKKPAPQSDAANAEEYAAAMTARVEKAISDALAAEKAERAAKEAEELRQVEALADFVIKELAHAA